MRQVNVSILHASDATSETGAAIDSNQLISASFQAVFGDSSAAGTLTIQASNDVAPLQISSTSTFTPTNWVAIPNATATVTAGASVIILIPQMAFRFIRAVYTSSSAGSTTITVNMFAMSI